MKYWGIIVAAGKSKRMKTETPKQYLMLAGKPVIQYALELFLNQPRFEKIIVVLDPHDLHWQTINLSDSTRISTVIGGEERADSVLAGLNALSTMAKSNDWVVVHDAARPHVSEKELTKLMNELENNPVGGILACHSVDTLKKTNQEGKIESTMPRKGVFRALTPQMFRYQLLLDGLHKAKEQGIRVTDESHAVEQLDREPQIIEGNPMNIKITYPEDLNLLAYLIGRE